MPVKTSTLEDYQARILRVLQHIHDNLDEELALEDLAAIASLSRFHFHRIFSGMMGESLHQLVRRLRLERAAWQLRETAEPIIQIALGAGYQTPESFSRVFSQHFAANPRSFRQSEDNRPLLPNSSGIHYLPGQAPLQFHPQPPPSYLMNASIKTIPSLRVASIRHVGPYNECGPTWEQLMSTLGAEGDLGPGTRTIGIGYDDPDAVPADQLRYDASVTVSDDFVAPDGITVREIAGGDYAVYTHQGSYEGLAAAYQKLFGQWIPRSGREPANAPCFEEYLNDPDSTDPEDLITEIYVPLA